MRQRLAGELSVGSLDTFASILEPIKGYVRHQHRYTSSYAFNRLVDSIAPESEAARSFRVAVDSFLKAAPIERNGDYLRTQLTAWNTASQAVLPLMQANSLLVDDIPAAEAVRLLTDVGLASLNYLESGKAVPDNWKSTKMKIVSKYDNKRVGDLLIQITPAVEKLVNAVKQ